MNKILDVKPVFEDRDYFCSENSAATVLGYYGIKKTPSELNKTGCVDFFTISKCMGKDFKPATTNLTGIRYAIENNHPVIVSTIPDTNVKKQERHSIVIIGFKEAEPKKYIGTLLAIDNGKKIEISRDDFERVWHRAGHHVISKFFANMAKPSVVKLKGKPLEEFKLDRSEALMKMYSRDEIIDVLVRDKEDAIKRGESRPPIDMKMSKGKAVSLIVEAELKRNKNKNNQAKRKVIKNMAKKGKGQENVIDIIEKITGDSIYALLEDESKAEETYLKIANALKSAGFEHVATKFVQISTDEGNHWHDLNKINVEHKIVKQPYSKQKKSNAVNSSHDLKILFFENDTGEVNVFSSPAKAIKFVETGWIEDILRRDENNVVIAAIITKIDSDEVAGMAENQELSMDVKTTVFSLDKQGEYQQVSNEDEIHEDWFYYIVKKQIARIEATFKDPDTGKFKHAINEPAIKQLKTKIKKLQA